MGKRATKQIQTKAVKLLIASCTVGFRSMKFFSLDLVPKIKLYLHQTENLTEHVLTTFWHIYFISFFIV